MKIGKIKIECKKVNAFNLSADEIAKRNKICNEKIKGTMEKYKYSDPDACCKIYGS